MEVNLNPQTWVEKQRKHEFVIQKVQPALLGLMDGSVSTLAPLFATAGLTGRPMDAFYVGLAASLGAGISMGLAEALSDDGSVTGRGSPFTRGLITGLATAFGGMLHTLPFLISNLYLALRIFTKSGLCKKIPWQCECRLLNQFHLSR